MYKAILGAGLVGLAATAALAVACGSSSSDSGASNHDDAGPADAANVLDSTTLTDNEDAGGPGSDASDDAALDDAESTGDGGVVTGNSYQTAQLDGGCDLDSISFNGSAMGEAGAPCTTIKDCAPVCCNCPSSTSETYGARACVSGHCSATTCADTLAYVGPGTYVCESIGDASTD